MIIKEHLIHKLTLIFIEAVEFMDQKLKSKWLRPE